MAVTNNNKADILHKAGILRKAGILHKADILHKAACSTSKPRHHSTSRREAAVAA